MAERTEGSQQPVTLALIQDVLHANDKVFYAGDLVIPHEKNGKKAVAKDGRIETVRCITAPRTPIYNAARLNALLLRRSFHLMTVHSGPHME